MDSNNMGAYIPGQYPFFPQKKKAVWPWVLAGVLIFFLVIVPVISVVLMMTSDGTEQERVFGSDFVAVLYIQGAITGNGGSNIGFSSDPYNQEFLLKTVRELSENDKNVGIMLYINSPGGELYATDELYRELIQYKDTTGRPIYAYCAEMAASGGYYLACAADKIYANPICTTGSIGVTYGTHIDVSGFLEKAGIVATPLVSDNNKMMGDMFSPLTAEQREIFESQIDEYYKLFLSVVMDGRGMTETKLRSLADGRTYTTKQALKAGLIDGASTFRESVEIFFTDCEFSAATTVEDFYYTVTGNDLLSMFLTASGFKKQTGATELEAYLSVIDSLSGPVVYYTGP